MTRSIVQPFSNGRLINPAYWQSKTTLSQLQHLQKQTKNRFSVKSGQNRTQVDAIGKMWTQSWSKQKHLQKKVEMLFHAFKRKLGFFTQKSILLSSTLSGPIHPKSESPGSPDSANYLTFPQNYSLRTRKLPTLLC